MFVDYDEIIAPICETISNSINHELVLVFGNKYFGKTKLIDHISEKLKSCSDTYIIRSNNVNLNEFGYANDLCKCYSLAIIYTYKDTTNKKKKKLFQRELTSAAKIRFNWHNRTKQDTILKAGLSKCSFDILLKLLAILANDKPYAFLINCIDLSLDEINFICQANDLKYHLCIDYVMGIRPKKNISGNLKLLLEKFDSHIHMYFLKTSTIDYKNILPPYSAKPILISNGSTTNFNENEYVQNILSIPEYSDSQNDIVDIDSASLILYANLFAYEHVTYSQIQEILNIMNLLIKERPLSQSVISKNPIVWFINGKYFFIDAWKYYLFFKSYGRDIVKETQNFFFIYYNRVISDTLSTQLNIDTLREINDKIQTLRSSENISKITESFAKYYTTFIDKSNWLICKGIKKQLSSYKAYLFAKEIINMSYEISIYSLRLIRNLFGSTQKLDILDYALDKIFAYISCFSSFNKNYIDKHTYFEIIDFLCYVYIVGDRWHDVNIRIAVIQIVESMLNKNADCSDLRTTIVKFVEMENIMIERAPNTYLYYCEARDEARRKQMENVTIGIITALPKECAAMRRLLIDSQEYFFEGKGAGHRFYIGEIASIDGKVHTVALGLCGMGNNNAAIRVTKMLTHFPKIKHIIMCGIAGGIPSPDDGDKHVRLGDIVVSEGIVQYDFIADTIEGIKPRSKPVRPSAALLEGVRGLQVDEFDNIFVWKDYIRQFATGPFVKPNVKTDLLYDNNDKVISHLTDTKRDKFPKVFNGVIASANTLLKNPEKRSYIKKSFDAFAVEMEGSGVADAAWDSDTGYIVIRGICDYGDSHKNNIWQEYASLVAAAYTRALIEKLPLINE